MQLQQRQQQQNRKQSHAHQTSPVPTIHVLPSPHARYYDFSSQVVRAVRATHCRVLSAELAVHVERLVTSSRLELADVATQLSTCATTRTRGGDTGWYYFDDDPDRTTPSTNNGDAHASSPSPTTTTAAVAASDDEEKEEVFTDEFLAALRSARPLALRTVHNAAHGYYDIFIVTDVRHAVRPSSRGADRSSSTTLNGSSTYFTSSSSVRRMRRKRTPETGLAKVEPMTYFIDTLGCQMNESDSQRMAAQLQGAGYTVASRASRSAVYVLNTCALREHAQQKVYSYMGAHVQRKWDMPDQVTLIVAGCVAQQEGAMLLSSVPEIDVVIGPQYANRLAEVLSTFFRQKAQLVFVDHVHISEDLSLPSTLTTPVATTMAAAAAPTMGHTKETKQNITQRTTASSSSSIPTETTIHSVTAWVNVIYGCNERCAYCVVPNTRGLEQSRPMQAIRDEISRLVTERGVKEVVLLGQNVDAYGRDLYPKRTFADLLQHVHNVPGLKRIRFTTGHPRYISQRLISTVADFPNVMEHFHIPPQSGSNAVLRAMCRGYSRERYMAIVTAIRARMPDAAVCADMIVGFPGETDAMFEESLSLADEVVFDANMVRAFSARPNTTAAELEDQVDHHVMKVRLERMNEKMREHALQRSRRYLGRIVEVLVEGSNHKVEGEMKGRERTNRMVFFPGDAALVGRIVEVAVREAYAFSLRGEIVSVMDN